MDGRSKMVYVVHTYSGYENKVASNLEKTVEKPLSPGPDPRDPGCPRRPVTEITDAGKRKEVERKIFPGLRDGEDDHDRRVLVRRPEHPGLHRVCGPLFVQAHPAD